MLLSIVLALGMIFGMMSTTAFALPAGKQTVQIKINKPDQGYESSAGSFTYTYSNPLTGGSGWMYTLGPVSQYYSVPSGYKFSHYTVMENSRTVTKMPGDTWNLGQGNGGQLHIHLTTVHVHSWTWVTDPATCTTAGARYQTCSCGQTQNRTTISALGHIYGNWYDNNSSNSHYVGCGSTQHKEVCTRCNAVLNYASHSYGSWYTSGSQERRDCTTCNHYETRNAQSDKVTLTYHANGGSNPPAAQTVDKGTQVTVKGQESMTRGGYEFLGWNTNQNATTANWNPNDTMKLNENQTLYAVWKQKNVHAYYYDGDTLVYSRLVSSGLTGINVWGASDGYAVGTEKDGKTFQGWATTKGGSVVYLPNDSAATTGKDMYFYAVWKSTTPQKIVYRVGDIYYDETYTTRIGTGEARYFTCTEGTTIKVSDIPKITTFNGETYTYYVAAMQGNLSKAVTSFTPVSGGSSPGYPTATYWVVLYYKKAPAPPVDNGKGIDVTKTRVSIKDKDGKAVTRTEAYAGDTITWHIKVTNLSNVEKTVNLTEMLDGAELQAGFSKVILKPAGQTGSSATIAATYVVKKSDEGKTLVNTVAASTGKPSDNKTASDGGTPVARTRVIPVTIHKRFVPWRYGVDKAPTAADVPGNFYFDYSYTDLDGTHTDKLRLSDATMESETEKGGVTYGWAPLQVRVKVGDAPLIINLTEYNYFIGNNDGDFEWKYTYYTGSGTTKGNSGTVKVSTTCYAEQDWMSNYYGPVSTTPVDPSTPASLSVTKTADKETVAPGDEVTYTISVFNNGGETAENVTVTDKLDDRLEFVSAKLNGNEITPNGSVYAVGNLASQTGAVLEITAKVKEGTVSGTLSNTATADYTGKPDGEDPKGSEDIKVNNPEKPEPVEKVTVTYKNGETELDKDTIDKGTEYEIKDLPDGVTPPDDGKEFDHWLGDDGKEYKPGDKIKPEHDLVLTPVWKDKDTEPDNPDNPTPDNPTPDDPTPDNPTPDNPTPDDPTPDNPDEEIPDENPPLADPDDNQADLPDNQKRPTGGSGTATDDIPDDDVPLSDGSAKTGENSAIPMALAFFCVAGLSLLGLKKKKAK